MGKIENAMAWRTVLFEEQSLNIKRLTFTPGFEGRRSKDVVEGHRQFHAIFGREESIHRERAKFIEGRCLGLQDKLGQVNALPFAPMFFENI